MECHESIELTKDRPGGSGDNYCRLGYFSPETERDLAQYHRTIGRLFHAKPLQKF